MKYHTYICSLAILLAMGCISEPSSSTQISRIIRNESGHEVKIITYFTENFYSLYSRDGNGKLIIDTVFRDSIKTTILQDGEQDNIYASFLSERGNRPKTDDPLETMFTTDSVIVVYDNEKFEVHCLFYNAYVIDPSDSVLNCNFYLADQKNIILFKPTNIHLNNNTLGYELIRRDDDFGEWLYTITAEDYENAQDCNNRPRCDY